MNFYGLLTSQKTNFNLASKWFGTAKQGRHLQRCLFCLAEMRSFGWEPPKVVQSKQPKSRDRLLGLWSLEQRRFFATVRNGQKIKGRRVSTISHQKSSYESTGIFTIHYFFFTFHFKSLVLYDTGILVFNLKSYLAYYILKVKNRNPE